MTKQMKWKVRTDDEVKYFKTREDAIFWACNSFGFGIFKANEDIGEESSAYLLLGS